MAKGVNVELPGKLIPKPKGIKKKKVKDPNAPKRPQTSFFMFCELARAQIQLVRS